MARSRAMAETELKSNVNIGSFPPFEDHMSFEDADKLRLNDLIDHRDPVGKSALATVVQKKGSILKIHYTGWKKKWDNWCDYAIDGCRFAMPGSISLRTAHRFQELKVGDYVDVNPILRHPGWKCGEILRLDHQSGQVHIVYDCEQTHFLYWAHFDNENEIAEFASKSGTNYQQKEMELKVNDNLPRNQFPEEKQVISKYENLPPPPGMCIVCYF